jgi:hypothetical protein
MPSSIVIPMIVFASIFLTTGITSLVMVLKAHKKLRTLYTESYAYITAEYDYNSFRLLLAISIIGLVVAFLPLTWSVY